MDSNKVKALLRDVKRLIDAAQEDYEKEQWNNHSNHVAEFNLLLQKAKDLNIEFDMPEIREAEKDQVVPISWSVGTPYNPPMTESYGSKTRKFREVRTSADKLYQAIVSAAGVEEDATFWSLIHPSITGVAKSRFEAGHYADSVETAFKHINENVKVKVKRKTGNELDGSSLMNTAFSPRVPVITLDDLSTESGRNIQQGFMQIFAGAMTGVRNPKAHGVITIDKERATHFLFLASLLMYKLDEAI